MGWALLLGLVALSSAAVGAAGILWWWIPRLEPLFLFRPTRYVLRTPAQLGVPHRQLFLQTPDGCTLSAWHLRPHKPRAAVLYFHGNGGNLGLITEVLALLYRHRLEVLALDYRGYGWSTGVPSEAGLYLDSLTAVREFRARCAEPGLPLLYWGRSMGGCVAAYAASREPPAGLILESTFPSKRSLLRHSLRLRFFGLFSRGRLDTLAYLEGHRFPVLVIHGDTDPTVPLEQGRRLFEDLSGPKEFYLVEGADHLNVHFLDSGAYMRRVLRFVEGLSG